MLNLQKWLLNEALSTFNYEIPDDKEQQMADFYAMSMFRGRSSFDLARLKNIKEKGIDSYQFGKPFNVDKDMSNEDYVDYALAEITNKLLPFLKESLKKDLLYSICAEVRHATDNNSAGFLVKMIDAHLGEKYAKIYKKYYKDFYTRNILDDERNTGIVFSRRVKSDMEKDTGVRDYLNSYKAFLYSKANPRDFVLIGEFLFSSPTVNWNASYGGKSWENICKAWLALDDAKNFSDMFVQIDHIYDIQHNTGSVFDKLTSYTKNNSFRWMKDFLDKKANISNPLELYQHVSPGIKKILAKATKLKFDRSLESVQNKFEVLKKNKFLADSASRIKTNIDKASGYWVNYNEKVDIEKLTLVISHEEYQKIKDEIRKDLSGEYYKYEEAMDYFLEKMCSLQTEYSIRPESLETNMFLMKGIIQTNISTFPKRYKVIPNFISNQTLDSMMHMLNGHFYENFSKVRKDSSAVMNLVKTAMPVLRHGQALAFGNYIYNVAESNVNKNPASSDNLVKSFIHSMESCRQYLSSKLGHPKMERIAFGFTLGYYYENIFSKSWERVWNFIKPNERSLGLEKLLNTKIENVNDLQIHYWDASSIFISNNNIVLFNDDVLIKFKTLIQTIPDAKTKNNTVINQKTDIDKKLNFMTLQPMSECSDAAYFLIDAIKRTIS